MTTWIQQLTATPGNYAAILQILTPGDGECLQSIYTQLEEHAVTTGSTLQDYVNQGICVSIEQDGSVINLPSIATLRAVGLLITTDNVHLGLTLLGYGFMQAMLTESP
ncbi:MAG: hypothetical protein ACO3NK_18930 [Prochlorotrichaceae cyanobacterium]|jgi:hypothetical protein